MRAERMQPAGGNRKKYLAEIFGIHITGVSVNPARSLGPALIVGGKAMAQVWLFLVVPSACGAVAGLLFRAKRWPPTRWPCTEAVLESGGLLQAQLRRRPNRQITHYRTKDPHQADRRKTMADLEQLKTKYADVISELESFADLGATLDAVDLDGEQLHIKGSVPSRVVLERVWDAIKAADPTYADLHHEIANTGGDDQAYTIKSGDNLSTIAKRFYGQASKYPEVAKANGIDNPDHIRVGQDINLPVL
jgi:hypothetical protein